MTHIPSQKQRPRACVTTRTHARERTRMQTPVLALRKSPEKTRLGFFLPLLLFSFLSFFFNCLYEKLSVLCILCQLRNPI